MIRAALRTLARYLGMNPIGLGLLLFAIIAVLVSDSPGEWAVVLAVASGFLSGKHWRPADDYTEAQRLYLSVQDAYDKAKEQLDAETDPAARASLLLTLAGLDAFYARIHVQAWGPQPVDEGDGRDMADSFAASSDLYAGLGAAEDARATGRPRARAADPIEGVAGWYLDELVETVDHAIRADVLRDIQKALVPMIGRQAAGVLSSLIDAEAEFAKTVTSTR